MNSYHNIDDDTYLVRDQYLVNSSDFIFIFLMKVSNSSFMNKNTSIKKILSL